MEKNRNYGRYNKAMVDMIIDQISKKVNGDVDNIDKVSKIIYRYSNEYPGIGEFAANIWMDENDF